MKHEIIDGHVVENRKLAEGVFRMVIRWSLDSSCVRSGQFVNVYPKSKETLLPRPISICDANGDRLTLVYGVVGKGTAEFSGYRPGETIRLSSPLGNGYDLDAVKNKSENTSVLIGGGIGVPPLIKLTRDLRAAGVNVIAVLGYRKEPFLLDELEEAGAQVYVATDSGAFGYKGTVLDLIRRERLQGDTCFACGPKGMLRAVAVYGKEHGWDVQVSMEERMGCGYGACVGCVVDILGEDGVPVRKKVCKDGPVFKGSEVVWDGE